MDLVLYVPVLLRLELRFGKSERQEMVSSGCCDDRHSNLGMFVRVDDEQELPLDPDVPVMVLSSTSAHMIELSGSRRGSRTGFRT